MTGAQLKALKNSRLVSLYLGKEYLIGYDNMRRAKLIQVTNHGYNFLLPNDTCFLRRRHLYLTKPCRARFDGNKYKSLEFRVSNHLSIIPMGE